MSTAKRPNDLFHYTMGHKLELIDGSSALLPFGYSGAAGANERPVLWFSEHATWEPTATKILSRDNSATFFRPSLRELHETAGAYRFRLNLGDANTLSVSGIALHPWSKLHSLARYSRLTFEHMIRRGVEFGARPTQWWGSFDPVSTELLGGALLTLEVLQLTPAGDVDSWVPTTIQQAIDEYRARGIRVAHTNPTLTPNARGL